MVDTSIAAALLVGTAVALPALWNITPRDKNQLKEILTRTGVKWSSEEERGALGRKLVQAGLDIPPAMFAGLRVALSSGFVILCLPLMLLGLDLFWIILLSPALYFLPGIWLNGKVAERKSAVRQSLADFSVLFSTALAAGADLILALREAASGVGGPIAAELDHALREHGVGRNINDALMDMAERLDVDELRSLVRTIVQSYRYGTPLAQTMLDHSEQLRTVRRFEVMEAAGKLTVKLTIPVLIFMLVPCMIALGFPAAIALIEAFGN